MKSILYALCLISTLFPSHSFTKDLPSNEYTKETENVDFNSLNHKNKHNIDFLFLLNGAFKQGYREFYYNSAESVPKFFTKGISGGFGIEIDHNLFFLTSGFTIDKGTVEDQFSHWYTFKQYSWNILASYYRSIKIEKIKHCNINLGFKAGGLIDETTVYARYEDDYDDVLDGHGHFGGPSLGLRFRFFHFMYTYLFSEDFLGGSMLEVGFIFRKKLK